LQQLMANVMYPVTAEKIFLGTFPDIITGDVVAYLIDVATYTYDAAHEFLEDIAVGARVAQGVTLSNKSSAVPRPGVFDADDIIFPSVTGASIGAIVLVRTSGVESSSELLWYLDNVTGLPATPDGRDITITWPSGANRIAAMVP